MPNYIDVPAGNKLWTEEQITLYNQLPFYLAESQVSFFNKWETWPKLLRKKKWQANMGPIMKGVNREPVPILRQTFFPVDIESLSKKDILETREVSEQARLRKHRFESALINFIPSFQDFLKHIDWNMTCMNAIVKASYDIFLRTYIFHAAPYVWICGKSTELTSAPYITGALDVAAKTTAFLQNAVSQCTAPLNLKNVNKLGTVMEEDVGADYYEGSAGQTVSEGLKGKYCLVTHNEVWNNFPFDTYLLANRPLDMNIVTDRFKGNLWGKWTTLIERYPIRINADGTLPASPETVEENSSAYDYGRTKPNPDYVNAPFAVSFAMGSDAYEALEVGPPPSPFSSGEMDMGKFRALQWNGEVQFTRDFLVKELDENNNVVLDTNKYGEYGQLCTQLAMGIIAIRRANVIPIIHLRQRVGANLS